MRLNKSGFTIVELLIVIVVIAILAAISIVAYNGIQARAKLTLQTAEINRIGKAIQLWSAEKGTSFASSDAGVGRTGVGEFQRKNDSVYPSSQSIEDVLRAAGYFMQPINPDAFSGTYVLLSPCTTPSDPRWVVYARVTPAPPKPVSQQVAETGCTHPYLTTFTDPSGSYQRNFVRAY